MTLKFPRMKLIPQISKSWFYSAQNCSRRLLQKEVKWLQDPHWVQLLAGIRLWKTKTQLNENLHLSPSNGSKQQQYVEVSCVDEVCRLQVLFTLPHIFTVKLLRETYASVFNLKSIVGSVWQWPLLTSLLPHQPTSLPLFDSVSGLLPQFLPVSAQFPWSPAH